MRGKKVVLALVAAALLTAVAYAIRLTRQSAEAGTAPRLRPSAHVQQISDAIREAEKAMGG